MNNASESGTNEPMSEGELLRRSVDLALQNADRGQLPFAALVVREGRIVAEGVNTALRDWDPVAHAEVAAVRRACADQQTLDLTGALVISSCEPCAICQSVAAATGITEIVYAASKDLVPDLGDHGPREDRKSVLFQAVIREANQDAVRHVPTEQARAPFDRWLALVDAK